MHWWACAIEPNLPVHCLNRYRVLLSTREVICNMHISKLNMTNSVAILFRLKKDDPLSNLINLRHLIDKGISIMN